MVDNFILSLKADGCSPRTLEWYEEKLRRLERWLEKPIDQASIQDLRRFVAHLQERRERYENHPTRNRLDGGLSPHYIRSHVRAVKRFFSWLVNEGLVSVESNPAARLKLPKVPRGAPRGVEMPDVERLLKAARAEPREYAILLFLVDTGCRAGEVCGLELADLDLERGTAFVRGKGQKERVVGLLTPTLKAVKEWLLVRPEGKGERVFVGKRGGLSPSGLSQLLRQLKREAGVRGRCNPHSFRHALAREWLDADGDLASLSEFLGHSDIKTTKDFYALYTSKELLCKQRRLSPVNRLFREDSATDR